VDNKLREWLGLVAQISHVQLTEGSDYFKWSLTKSGLYTVRSLYHHLIDTQPPFHHKDLEDEDSTKNKDFSLVSTKGGRSNQR
jgi:hypothetical protein